MSSTQQQQKFERHLNDWIISGMKEESNWKIMTQKMDEWMSDNKKRSYLEKNYACELAYIHSIRKDLPKTKTYLYKAFDQLLNQWCNLPNLASNAKKELLSTLQKV